MARVRKKEARYQSLYNLRNMMRAEKDLDLLLDFIVKESANIVDADRASLFLLDDITNELWSKIALGINEIMRFNTEQGIAGEVFRSGKVLNVTNAYRHKKFNSAMDKKTGYVTNNILCVPLKDIQGETIGVLQALNKKDGTFTSDDEDILQIFASNAAVAIGNAQLIKKLSGTKSHLERENKVLKEKSMGKFFINNIIGTSQKISEVVSLIEKIAVSPLDVLITGESGTGKELAARMIHYNSPRSENAFVDINCAALPDSILESELFGIEKGVATGVESRAGKIETANEGTLFLDEIGDMSLAAQAKLLRALQEKKITRLGGKKGITIDFRVIAATNKDLREEINNNSFREDLFYRLNVVHIEMPSLREIKEDIQVIAKHFLNNYAEEYGKDASRFSKDVIERFEEYPWPGNVRELENEVKRSIIISEGKVIQVTDLTEHIREYRGNVSPSLPDNAAGGSFSMKKSVEDLEIRMITDALTKTRGNKEKASELLGITRQGLFKKMKRYSMS